MELNTYYLAGACRRLSLALLVALGVITTGWCGTFPAESQKDLKLVKHRIEAAHFLSHTTFGPTIESIEALANRMSQIGRDAALEEWIDAQFALEPTSHYALALDMIADDGFDPVETKGVSMSRYRQEAWWHAAIAAPDQLRQRVAWALAQIFVINEFEKTFNSQMYDASGNPRYLGIVDYFDMLVGNAYGNYRGLLEDVTFHPIMGVFLSHRRCSTSTCPSSDHRATSRITCRPIEFRTDCLMHRSSRSSRPCRSTVWRTVSHPI